MCCMVLPCDMLPVYTTMIGAIFNKTHILNWLAFLFTAILQQNYKNSTEICNITIQREPPVDYKDILEEIIELKFDYTKRIPVLLKSEITIPAMFTHNLELS